MANLNFFRGNLMINSLKKAAVVATLFTVASSLTPKSADAGFAKSTRLVMDSDPFTYALEIDTSVKDSQVDLKEGIFSRAFIFSFSGRNENYSLRGDVKSYLVEDITTISNVVKSPGSFGDTFKKVGKAVRFEGGNDKVRFQFFAPFSDPNSLSFLSTSNLSRFFNEKKEVKFSGSIKINRIVVNGSGGLATVNFPTFTFGEDPKKVPESSTMFGIFTLFSLASASRFKRLNRKNSHLPCTSSK
jgi:hypothetical protein